MMGAPGSEIDRQDRQGYNCLYYATYYGHINVLQRLKQQGVRYEKSYNGTTCLHMAAKRGLLSVVDFFLTRTDLYREKEAARSKSLERKNTLKDNQNYQKLEAAINKAVAWERQIDVDE